MPDFCDDCRATLNPVTRSGMDPARAPTVIPTVPMLLPAVFAACCGVDMRATTPTSAAIAAKTLPTTATTGFP